MRRGFAVLMGCAGVAAGAAGFGCASDPSRGYSLAPVHDTSIETVGVAMFENQTFRPGLGPQITEAIAKAIQRDTPWRLADPDVADTVLTGTIRNADLNRLSQAPVSGLVLEAAYQVTIDFAWVDGATGRRLAERQGLTAADIFVPARGTNERLEVAEREVVDELATAVVRELRSAW